MSYKVTRQYSKGSETEFATFTDLNDAKAFLEMKLQQDAAMRIAVIYRISQFGDVLVELDSMNTDLSANSGTSSQGQSSSSTARPTPFATAPRPASMPPKWAGSSDEDKDKK